MTLGNADARPCRSGDGCDCDDVATTVSAMDSPDEGTGVLSTDAPGALSFTRDSFFGREDRSGVVGDCLGVQSVVGLGVGVAVLLWLSMLEQ